MGRARFGPGWSPGGTAIVLVGRGGGGGVAACRVPATTTAATYLADRVLLSRGTTVRAVVNDVQPGSRP